MKISVLLLDLIKARKLP